MSDLRMLHPLDPARIALLDSRVDDLPQLAAETAEALIAQHMAREAAENSAALKALGLGDPWRLQELHDALTGDLADAMRAVSTHSLVIDETEPLPAASSGEENATGGEHT